MRISDWSSDVCSSDLHSFPGKQLIEFSGKGIIASQQTNQSFYILGHKKGVLPGISFSKIATTQNGHRRRIKIRVPVSRTVFATGKTNSRIHDILVISGPLCDRKSTRLNSSHSCASRMPASVCKNNNHNNITQTN